jgi:hypothetical protein
VQHGIPVDEGEAPEVEGADPRADGKKKGARKRSTVADAKKEVQEKSKPKDKKEKKGKKDKADKVHIATKAGPGFTIKINYDGSVVVQKVNKKAQAFMAAGVSVGDVITRIGKHAITDDDKLNDIKVCPERRRRARRRARQPPSRRDRAARRRCWCRIPGPSYPSRSARAGRRAPRRRLRSSSSLPRL